MDMANMMEFGDAKLRYHRVAAMGLGKNMISRAVAQELVPLRALDRHGSRFILVRRDS